AAARDPGAKAGRGAGRAAARIPARAAASGGRAGPLPPHLSAPARRRGARGAGAGAYGSRRGCGRGADARGVAGRARTVAGADERLQVHGGPSEVSADSVIAALPHARAAALLDELAPELARRVGGLAASPIINLHVVYDRRVCDLPFAAGVGTPVQYVFDRTAAARAPEGCQCLAISLSGAEREMAMSVQTLRERYLDAL